MGVSEKSSGNREKSSLPGTEIIKDEEFGELPRVCRFNFPDKASGRGCFFEVNGNEVRVGMTSDIDVREVNPDEELGRYQISDDGKEIRFPKENEKLEQLGLEVDENSGEKQEYYIDGLNPREINLSEREVQKKDMEWLAALINELEGGEIMIYTGAGISMDGEDGVLGMDELRASLGLDGSLSGDNFENLFRDNPDKLVDKVKEFGNSLFIDKSTEAHKAISKLVEKKPGVLVMTENIDLKHEAEGSRLAVTHMDGDNLAFGQVILRTNVTKAVIVVGMSHDDRAILEYMKHRNPDVMIVAIDNCVKGVPSFLGKEDTLIQGDCQKTLPELVERLNLEVVEDIESDSETS